MVHLSGFVEPVSFIIASGVLHCTFISINNTGEQKTIVKMGIKRLKT